MSGLRPNTTLNEYRFVHLVQMLLPAQDEHGRPFPRESYDSLVATLTDRFGGVTAYTRAPATGLWEAEPGRKVRDEVVVYEVMVEKIERDWWAGTRRRLEVAFAQQEIVIRAHAIERL